MHHNINRGQQKAALLFTNSMNIFSFTRVHALFCQYYIFFVRFSLEGTRVGAITAVSLPCYKWEILFSHHFDGQNNNASNFWCLGK